MMLRWLLTSRSLQVDAVQGVTYISCTRMFRLESTALVCQLTARACTSCANSGGDALSADSGVNAPIRVQRHFGPVGQLRPDERRTTGMGTQRRRRARMQIVLTRVLFISSLALWSSPRIQR